MPDTENSLYRMRQSGGVRHRFDRDALSEKRRETINPEIRGMNYHFYVALISLGTFGWNIGTTIFIVATTAFACRN